jgi:hypothetical protein
VRAASENTMLTLQRVRRTRDTLRQPRRCAASGFAAIILRKSRKPGKSL